jgi:hypothetical protein
MLAQRMSRTEMSLKNIDTNNNGIIDADEAKDPRAKGQLDRIFGRMNKEPHYPMAISEIMSSYEAFIKTQPQGGFGGPPGQGPGGGPGFGQGGGFPPRDGSSPRDGFPQRDGGPQGRDGGFQGRDGGFPGRDRSQQRDPSGGAPANTSGLTSLPGMGFGSTSQPSRSDGGTISPTSFIIPASGIPAARMPAATDAKPVPKKPSRFATGPERLPKGLPQWFLDIDVNGTGQITMAQYTENWTTQKVEKFNRYDLNHDGIITAEEVLKVEKAKADSN